jgi:hypothetical protein
MISFRFHVVSITAVFLAIAIGVVVGTTYVDRAVVDSLESRVDRVSRNLDQRKAENDALDGALGDLRRYAGASTDWAVTGRLTDVPVMLLAVRGLDGDVANTALQLARRAGAAVPGVTWLEGRWALEGDDDHDALATAAGVDASSSDTTLRADAISALVSALSVPAEGATNEEAAAMLDRMVEAGFLTVDVKGDGAPALDELAGTAPRVLLLSSSDVADKLGSLIGPLASRASAAGLATVAAEAYVSKTDGPKRGEVVLTALDDARDRVSVVDDLEVPEGRVAAILALAEVSTGQVGHFGYGDGADGVLPAWTAP